VFAVVMVSVGRSCAVGVGVLSARRARTRISCALVFSVGSNAFGHFVVVCWRCEESCKARGVRERRGVQTEQTRLKFRSPAVESYKKIWDKSDNSNGLVSSVI
jgi:hypothetical protein